MIDPDATTRQHADSGDRARAAPEEGIDGFIAFLKDNLEAIAVAVVMALVIKHFCVEAFKIPTSSMWPTLRGETDNERGEGDRILVDKFAYLVRDPARWDVVVFRYPLNSARNFIKRIAGLPGEHLRISADGDLWVRPTGKESGAEALRIPQKPRMVREQFYRPVYPPPESEEDDADSRASDLRHLWRGHGDAQSRWRVEGVGEFGFDGGETAELRTGRHIRSSTTADSWAHSGSSGEMVRDARFRARVRVPARNASDDAPQHNGSDGGGSDGGGSDGGGSDGGGSNGGGGAAAAPESGLSLSWRADDEFLAVLALSSKAGASRAFIRRGAEVVVSEEIDVRLTAGSTVEVELEYVDGTLRAHADGRELVVLTDGRRYEDTHERTSEQFFALTAFGAPLVVEDLRIDRDLRYQNNWDVNAEAERHGVEIPDDSYFMLGDHTTNSSDSRKWRMVTVRLTGGRSIRHERGETRYLDDEEAPDDRSWKRVVDANGITRQWPEEEEVDGHGDTYAAPFVRRDLIVGRAFLVFWPCWPDFPGRLGFIH